MIPILFAIGGVGLVSVLINVAAYADAHASEAPVKGRRRLQERLASTAFLAECGACASAVAGAMLPPRAVGAPTAGAPRGTVVVLSPRFGPRGAMRLLVRRLRARGWRTILCPARFDASAPDTPDERLTASIERHVGPGEPLTLLAYGTAGLSARAYAARHSTARPLRLMTVATAHQGTEAKLSRTALRPGSECLARLARADAAPRHFDAIALYSDFDAWVRPLDNAYYPGAFNIEVRGIGHMAMLFSRRAFDIILENVSAPLAATGTSDIG